MKRTWLKVLLATICYSVSGILIVYVLTIMSMLSDVLLKLDIDPSILIQCIIFIGVASLLTIIGILINLSINSKNSKPK